MNEAKKQPEESEESVAENASPEDDVGAEAIDLGPAEEADDPIAILEAEKADLKDQLLRALAESENIRRRSRKDVEDATKYGGAKLARDLLAVADNLARALDAIPKDRLADDHELKNLFEGVELVERDLQSAFAKHGIEKLSPLGEKFDPNRHQAMFEIPDADAAPGTVVQLMAPGYVMHDRLLRAAMVGVAKAPPAEDAAAGAEKPAEGDQE